MYKIAPFNATKGPQQPPAAPHRITHRQQRWRSSQSSTESGHLALPLELRGLDKIRDTLHSDASIPVCVGDSLHLSTALQLHLIAHLHLPKAIVRHIQMLQRLVDTKDITKGLGTSSAQSTT